MSVCARGVSCIGGKICSVPRGERPALRREELRSLCLPVVIEGGCVSRSLPLYFPYYKVHSTHGQYAVDHQKNGTDRTTYESGTDDLDH